MHPNSILSVIGYPLVGLVGLLTLFVTACNPTLAEPEPPATAVIPTAIPTAEAPPTAPPPTATLPPTSTPLSQPTTAPDQSGELWIIQAKGVQCEGDKFESLDDAVKQTQAQGITVLAAEEIELMVTAVCGANTSTHYRLQIPAPDLPTAEQNGWTLENNQ